MCTYIYVYTYIYIYMCIDIHICMSVHIYLSDDLNLFSHQLHSVASREEMQPTALGPPRQEESEA